MDRWIELVILHNIYFAASTPSDKLMETAKKFLQCAVELGELESDYTLFGARQVSSTLSPGKNVYRKIQKWPNYISDPKAKRN